MSEKPDWVKRYEQEKGVEVVEDNSLLDDFFWLDDRKPRFALNQEGQVLALAHFNLDAAVFRSGSWPFVKRVFLRQDQVERGHFRTLFEALEVVIVTHSPGKKLTKSMLKPLQPYKKIGWIHSKLSDLVELSTRVDLEALWLHDNRIQDLSPLKALSSLQMLRLNDNQIQDLGPLKVLSSLKVLGLYGNQIQDLSPLAALSTLRTLYIGNNKIQNLKPLKALSSLQALGLSLNQIQDLSPLKGLSTLKRLWLNRNQIQDLSPLKGISSLEKLWLERNQIQDLSPLKALSSLLYVDIADNPIQTPPPEIAREGLDAIRDYFRQLDAGADPLYEAKILVVGEPGAGKTSLIGKLLDSHFRVPDGTRSTHGIQIHRNWSFSLPKKPEVVFKAHLWDFGGSEIQYLTHQFFLQSRSLFLLVIESDKDSDHADCWFHTLNLLGQGSPVLVVINERDGAPINNFDLANYRRLFDKMTIREQRLNLAEAPDPRFNAMRQLAQQMFSELKHIGQPIPRSWLKVRGALEASKQKRLTWSDFAKICREEGLTEIKSQQNLAIYLHELGVVLFFHDDPELSQSLFLDPQWLVNAVHLILGDKSLKESNGRFSKEWMFAQWRRHGIDGGDCNLLLRLMLKNGFELCYPLEGAKEEEYLAPQLLSSIRPKLPARGKANLRLRFHYKFMPKGIISRLIVKFADDLAKSERGAHLVWLRGFVLARPVSKVHALVEEIRRHKGGKAVDILLWGPPHECQDLLSHIHELLRGIHRRHFPGLELQPHVPIPDNPDYDIPLNFLRTLQKKGVQSHYFEGSERPLDIALLLKGLPHVQDLANEPRAEQGQVSLHNGMLELNRALTRFNPDYQDSGDFAQEHVEQARIGQGVVRLSKADQELLESLEVSVESLDAFLVRLSDPCLLFGSWIYHLLLLRRLQPAELLELLGKRPLAGDWAPLVRQTLPAEFRYSELDLLGFFLATTRLSEACSQARPHPLWVGWLAGPKRVWLEQLAQALLPGRFPGAEPGAQLTTEVR